MVDLRLARRALMDSRGLSDVDKGLLARVSLAVHRKDSMYRPGKGQHYLSVGLSAVRCIKEILDGAGGHGPPRTILDFACGYGRVLRFLRVGFPDAGITAVEMRSEALDFCKKTFSAETVLSTKDLSRVHLPRRFDLIWCGSLVTHMDERSTMTLLRLFRSHLSARGICIFTTHGRGLVERMRKRQKTYNLTEEARGRVLSELEEKGYGYADYPNMRDYGVSVVSHERMSALARSFGNWEETCYKERGWADHQDVYAFAIRPFG
jgi:SAM-dependent methyltransferase